MQRVLLLLCCLVALCVVLSVSSGSASQREQDPLQGAEERIYQHRTGPATVVVLNSDDQPVVGATVEIEQVQHEFLFGCNIYAWGRQPTEELERAYRERFAALFNYATLPFYWWSYEPVPGRTQEARVRAIAQWCREHGIIPKGHPLAWNFADPAWLPESPDEVFRLQVRRVENIVRGFAGLIDIWDVVNEATHFEREECQRRAPRLTRAWLKVGRVPFIRACFQAARRGNPDATLLINDYRVDDAYARLLNQLRGPDGYIFDVIGLQSHQHGGTWPAERTWRVCERFARFGVPLHFTETTILSGEHRAYSPVTREPWPSTPEGERRQAEEVERFYTLLFSHPRVEAITWWDLSDRGAWRRAPAGLLRDDMSPKPAYLRLKDLIKGKWWTKTTARTNDSGRATFRGYFGRYRIRVRAGTKVIERELVLSRHASPPELTVRLP